CHCCRRRKTATRDRHDRPTAGYPARLPSPHAYKYSRRPTPGNKSIPSIPYLRLGLRPTLSSVVTQISLSALGRSCSTPRIYQPSVGFTTSDRSCSVQGHLCPLSASTHLTDPVRLQTTSHLSPLSAQLHARPILFGPNTLLLPQWHHHTLPIRFGLNLSHTAP